MNCVFCPEFTLIYWLAGRSWCRFQKSQRRKRSRSVEDDEEGHLICESGDVLRARCIEHFSTLFKNFSAKNLFRIVCQRRGAKEIFIALFVLFFLCFFVFLHIFFSVEFKYCVQKVPISKWTWVLRLEQGIVFLANLFSWHLSNKIMHTDAEI